jgi:hypothetical protein
MLALQIFIASLSCLLGKVFRRKLMTMKKEFEIGALFLAMLFVCTVLVPAVSAQGESLNTVEASKMISLEQAGKVASYSIKEISMSLSNFSEWKNATVGLSTVYYDLDGNKSAYSFNVIKNKQQVGYIITSATTDNFPVIEFSKGKIPNEIPELTTSSKSLVKERANKIKSESTDKEELTIGEMKSLYLGPTFYYTEYTLTDNKSKAKEKVIVDLTSSTIVNSNESNVSVPVGEKDYFYNSTHLKQQQEIRKQNANKQWTTLEKEIASSSSYSAASNQGYVNNVPYYSWLDGCSPTSSGMVLDYWSKNGFSNIPDTSDGYTLIDSLATAMGTSSTWPNDGATWPWNISPGIITVCQNCGYTGFSAPNNWVLAWNDVVNEVNAKHPFVLSMTASSIYGQHSVATVGYYIGGTQYVIIHDTWSLNDVYMQYGSWLAAMGTYVHH